MQFFAVALLITQEDCFPTLPSAIEKELRDRERQRHYSLVTSSFVNVGLGLIEASHGKCAHAASVTVSERIREVVALGTYRSVLT